jgi:hypothetical protein
MHNLQPQNSAKDDSKSQSEHGSMPALETETGSSYGNLDRDLHAPAHYVPFPGSVLGAFHVDEQGILLGRACEMWVGSGFDREHRSDSGMAGVVDSMDTTPVQKDNGTDLRDASVQGSEVSSRK